MYMQMCRCHWLRVLLAENRVGNGDLQSRLPAFLPYAPSCWAAAACGHRWWVRALHMARTSNGLTPRSRLSVAVKLQRVLRPARRHCATEHPVRSLGGVVNLHKTQWNFRRTRSPIDCGRHKAKSLCRSLLVGFAREQAPMWPKWPPPGGGLRCL